MKKILIVLLCLLAVSSTLFASDFSFVFGDLDQHSDILIGFLPTYLLAGAGYNGLELVEGSQTSIQLLVGGGYKLRRVWQDPDDGSFSNLDYPINYDVIAADWILRFKQGFMNSPVGGKDLLTLTVSYKGKYEYNKDSFRVGASRSLPVAHNLETLNSYLTGSDTGIYTGDIYPDLKGDGQILATIFNLALRFDMMNDQMSKSDGFYAVLDVDWAPYVLNHALSGEADYYSITLNLVGSKTLYNLNKNNWDWFSIVLIDRISANYTGGDQIPVFAQGPASLGRRMRGYNTWTYGSAFSIVNNLDLRFAGPGLGLRGIFPRINLFVDLGYGCGDYFNTSISASNFLASAGIELTVSFFDFIDLGYEVAYLFTGSKYTSGDDKIVTRFTFFLDF